MSLCNEVISSGQYSLESNFSDIWRDGLNGAGKNSPESIWEMQADVKAANGDDNSPQYNGSWLGHLPASKTKRSATCLEFRLGMERSHRQTRNDWSNDDPRKSQTILYSGEYDGGTPLGGFGAILPPYTNPDGTGGLAQKYWNKKLYTGNSPEMRSYTGYENKGGAGWINHRILRYADVILMLAEASNELGDGATAAANLELIRNRASGNLGDDRTIVPYIPFVDQAQMRTAIKNERRWEFALEGYRFYDLVRWGDALNALGPLGYTERCRYYPIPQKAIDQYWGVLKQNPEW